MLSLCSAFRVHLALSAGKRGPANSGRWPCSLGTPGTWRRRVACAGKSRRLASTAVHTYTLTTGALLLVLAHAAPSAVLALAASSAMVENAPPSTLLTVTATRPYRATGLTAGKFCCRRQTPDAVALSSHTKQHTPPMILEAVVLEPVNGVPIDLSCPKDRLSKFSGIAEAGVRHKS